MSHTPSSRIIVITSILFVIAAITVSANWGSVSGFGLFASNEEAFTVGGSLPALSGTEAIEYLKQNRQYDSLMEAFAATRKGQADETPTDDAFEQTAMLTASDGAADDTFGFTVAISGETAFVGAYQDDVGANSNQGSAYVFVRSGTTWSEQQKLTAADGAAGDWFGASVAISGETAIVGARIDDVGANNDQGSAYIFVRSGTAWSEQQKLTAADGAAIDRFGSGVAISGETAIVGASGDDVGANGNQGSAYIFVRSGTTWSEQQKLTAADGAAGDELGWGAAISGGTAIVGAYFDDVGANFNQGSAYVFTQQAATITGTVTYGNVIGAPTPRFVSNVTISGAGSLSVFTTTAAPGPIAGQYSLTGFGSGSYTVTPTKTGGVNGAISSFDAGRIALHVAGAPNPQLNATQLIVADVSGNGTISSFDAGQIARYVAAVSGSGSTGNWIFMPVNRSYASVSGNVTGEDFVALLMGEVSGSWTNAGARPAGGGAAQECTNPPCTSPHVSKGGTLNVESTALTNVRAYASRPASIGPERSIAVDPPNLTTQTDKEIIVPVNVQGVANKGIISYEFDLRYDPSVIQPQANPVDVAGTVSRGLSVVTNATEPGLLRVVVYGAFPIEGPIDDNGVLLNLRFTAVGEVGSISPLRFERLMFNEGEPRVMAVDGQIALF